MKKIVSFFVLILALTACDNGDTVDPRQPADLVLEEFYKNQDILNLAFTNGGIEVGIVEVKGTMSTSESKSEFILKMTELTHGLFVKAVEETRPGLSGYLKIGDIKGESKTAARLLDLLTGGGEEPLSDYYGLIKSELDKSSPATWDLIKSYRTEEGKEIPMEDMSLNYDQLASAIKLSDVLVTSISDQEQAEEIDAVAMKENLPPILIGLLLPAIQKMHEAETEDPLAQWLDKITEETISGGLDQDIIRRIKTAGYHAGLDQIINNRYDNTNQISTSAQILEARFEATMMFTWATIWDTMQ